MTWWRQQPRNIGIKSQHLEQRTSGSHIYDGPLYDFVMPYIPPLKKLIPNP